MIVPLFWKTPKSVWEKHQIWIFVFFLRHLIFSVLKETEKIFICMLGCQNYVNKCVCAPTLK